MVGYLFMPDESKITFLQFAEQLDFALQLHA